MVLRMASHASRVHRVERAVEVGRGIVDEDVEGAEPLDDGVDHRLRRRVVGDVRLDRKCAFFGTAFEDGVELVASPPADRHVRAVVQERLGNGATDSGTAAGDQDRLSLKGVVVHGHGHLLPVDFALQRTPGICVTPWSPYAPQIDGD
nr:hypothetical protein [Mycolicibacterium hodleri]